jgi:4-hydroxy-4-methyl-2-oxoglutarate aldolase
MPKFAPLNLTPDEIIRFTPEWDGERFDDGRPRVPDEILERMRLVTLTEAWGTLRRHEYHRQYEGGWMCTQPGKVLVGRAVTVVYMPRRDDLRTRIFALADEEGCIGDQVSWPIDTLVPGDVYVADNMGRPEEGAAIGDNLSTSILSKTGNGVVHDGSIRDMEGVRELEDFVSFCRAYDPATSTRVSILTGINCPITIGKVTVMPGDVVLGKVDGVIFIPPHLAHTVVKSSELVRIRDAWGKTCLREGRYTPGEIDRRWEAHIEDDFAGWLQANLADLPIPEETVQEYLEGRQGQ